MPAKRGHVAHSQADVETEFGAVSLILIFL